MQTIPTLYFELENMNNKHETTKKKLDAGMKRLPTAYRKEVDQYEKQA